MKKSILALFFVLLAVPLISQNNEQKFSGWKKSETEHFTFIYEQAQIEATKGFIKYADEAWNQIAKIYACPQNKTNVFIVGRTNTQNALTSASPVELEMYTTPIIDTIFPYRDNWQKLAITHELIHVANISFEGKNTLLPKLFGPFMYSLDFGSVNGWALEGLTTVLETELTKGGRGRSPYFELYYKASTLDNGFISYEDIGFEAEPPLSQNYVIGYMIMRSIADRFGIAALADIERNRPFLGSFEESVKLVTGVSPQDIYRDARIALAKKYAEERKIPEGIIISPREVNTYYHNPAIVNDDGTIIALRTAANEPAVVVKLDPSAKKGRNYVEDTLVQKDSNTLYSETILFSGGFRDINSVTADENGKIYAVMQIARKERFPGEEMEAAVYSWTKNEGLKRLTCGKSFEQPSVSRDGKVLVAMEQHGMDYRLVQINVETGDSSVLLEKQGLSFIQPAVNTDGTKVAFLELDGTRARVAVLDTAEPEKYQIVANNDEKIFDPSEPEWNIDGNLLFCCNYRGRLEIFEIDLNKASKTPKTVISDPIGAVWAYKNSKSIYYKSYSSSGYVIKIKPLEEWGVVPSFYGPSSAGEILHFGDLESDYPDFKPYNENKESNNIQNEIKIREPEFTEKANQAASKITELTNQKNYFCLTRPILYFPCMYRFSDQEKQNTFYGFGAFSLLLAPRLQKNGSFGFTNLFYYPTLNNFDGRFSLFSIPFGHIEIDFTLERQLVTDDVLSPFVELNNLQLGYTVPFINRRQGRNELYFGLQGYASSYIARLADKPSSIAAKYETKFGGSATAGFDFVYSKALPRNCYHTFDFVITGIAFCERTNVKPVFQFGVETELSYLLNQRNISYEISLRGRYTPFSSYICPPNSGITYGNKKLDCSMPVRVVPRFAILFPGFIPNFVDAKIYGELLGSSDLNFKNTFKFDKSVMTGFELGTYSARTEIATGVSMHIEYNKPVTFDCFDYYLRLKLSWYRGL